MELQRTSFVVRSKGEYFPASVNVVPLTAAICCYSRTTTETNQPTGLHTHTHTHTNKWATLCILTHCGRVTQICVFNTVKLGTSASSPQYHLTRGNVSRGIAPSSTTRIFGEYFLKISVHKNQLANLLYIFKETQYKS